MADRPTPQSVAVCALILALLESPPTPSGGKDEREHHQPPRDHQRKGELVGGGGGVGVGSGGVVTLPGLVRRLIAPPSLKSAEASDPSWGYEEDGGGGADGDGDGDGAVPIASSSSSSALRLLSSTLLPPPGDWSGGDGVPESAARAFRDTLDGCCESIDDLVDFFDRLRSMVGSGGVAGSRAGGAVDRDSSHGLYLRRQCLGFDTLSFEAVGRLWMALREYVQEARRPQRGGRLGGREGDEKDESFADAGHDEAMGDADADVDVDSDTETHQSRRRSNWPQSPKQIEGAIQRLCLSFDRTVLGRRSSVEVESEIRRLLADHPELPALHFLRFLNHLHHGERVGALESLHRYFDYAMIRERRIALSQAAAAAEAAAAAASSEGEESKQGDTAAAHQAHLLGSATGSVVQYASIELAALYREFGCDSLASRATEEAVRVAQQDRDDDCVAYALGWLPSPTCSSSGGGAGGTTTQVEELLRRCIARASSSSSNPSGGGGGSSSGLASGASLVLARHLAATSSPGAPRSPREIWDCLASASAGPSVSGGAGGVGGGGPTPSAGASARTGGGAGGRHHRHHHHHHRGPPVDQPVHLPPGCDPVEALSVPARCQLVASGVWETFGHTSLATSSTSTALHCHGDILSCGDYVSSVHGLATASLVGVSHSTGADGGGALSLDLDAAIGTVPLSLPHRGPGDVDEEKLDGGDDAPAPSSSDDDHCAYSLALRKLIDLRRRYGGVGSRGRHRHADDFEDELHLPTADVWVHAVSLLLHERAVSRGDFAHARALGPILHGSVPSAQRLPEAHVQSIGQYALLLYRQGWYDRAASVTSDLIDFCGRRGLHVPRARLLLQLASIRLESTTGMCGGGTSSKSMSIGGVLPPLLECMSLSECLSMDALHASASAVLAMVHLALGTVGCARALLRSCMPLVLAHAPLALQGEAWMTLAKCHMREAADRDRRRRGDGTTGVAGGEEMVGDGDDLRHRGKSATCPPPSRRRAVRELHLALSQVEEAIPLFRRCGDVGRLREALYLRARLCHALFPGDRERRNVAAAEFREVSSRMVGATCAHVYYDVMASISSTSELERVAGCC